MIGANAPVSIQNTSSIHTKTAQSVSVSPSVGGGSNEIRTTRRRFTVWASFVGGMTAVAGILLAGDRGAPSVHAAVSVTVDGLSPATDSSLILPRDAKPISGQWQAIVIHHSATPAGDSITLNRQHTASGLSGLGYHFVIGNGQGLGDGLVEVGYRWNRQLAGAHVAGATATESRNGLDRTSLSTADADQYNRHSIGICMIGNGNRREFTDRQMHELITLVRALQAQFGIPGSAVYLHSDLSKVTSPGKFFPTAEFEAQIRRP
jgi:hypothetical protein